MFAVLKTISDNTLLEEAYDHGIATGEGAVLIDVKAYGIEGLSASLTLAIMEAYREKATYLLITD